MRDEMANLAWAIERTVESPIEQPAQRYEAPDAAPVDPPVDPAVADLPRYLLSSQVPPNWIPLLPVQVPNPAFPNTAGQILSRLKRGAVLQPDGSREGSHAQPARCCESLGNQLLYDEEVPREGARITRQRRMARWTRRVDLVVDVVPESGRAGGGVEPVEVRSAAGAGGGIVSEQTTRL